MMMTVLRREALLMTRKPPSSRPGLRPSGPDTFGVDDVHDLPRLVGDDRLIGHEQRVERLQREEPQLAEHAERDEAVGIVDDGAQPNRAGAAVERVVEKVDTAWPAILALVLEADLDAARIAPSASRLYLSSADSARRTRSGSGSR